MGKKISIDSATMMNKVFEVIEAKKIFDLNYNQLKILIHPKSYLHAIVKFNNGLTKLLIHDTNMVIPIFNSLYPKFEKKIKTKNLNLNIVSNLKLKYVNKRKFPVMKLIDKLPNSDSLYETIVVSANDNLVNLFLKGKIKFNDIPKTLFKILNLKEFILYKKFIPKNVKEINKLANYVSLKINSMSV